HAWVAVVLVSAALAAALALGLGLPRDVRTAGGSVLVTAGPLLQVDDWTYVKTLSAQEASLNWSQDYTCPVLESPQQAQRIDLRLHCTAAGPQRFTWRAQAGAPMA